MLNINSFFKYSIYIGHSASNSLVLSSWFFYKLKRNIWIINLFKTIIFIKIVLKFLKHLATYNLPIWFINLELSKEYIFKKYALSCGEFACTKMWIRGFLSNFKSIQKSIGKYVLKRHVYKFSEKKNLIKTWALTRFTWPRGIFLPNVPTNYVICQEAASISLPVISLVDTNVKSYLINFPIPSNDDAIVSLNFILSLISKKLLLCKYKKIVSWYNKYKNKIKTFKSNYKSLKNYLKLDLKKLYKKTKKFFVFLGKTKKFNRLTSKSKKFLRDNFFNKNYWASINIYSQMRFIYNKKFKKFYELNSFDKSNKFFKNCNLLTKTIFSNYNNKINFFKSTKIYYKLKFLRLVKRNNKFLTNFIWRYKFETCLDPIELYRKTISLKFLRYKKRKRNLKKFYFFYYFLANYIKKSRVYHESFFYNLPSNFKFIKAFHKYVPWDHRPWYNKQYMKQQQQNNLKQWFWYKNYRYLLNFKAQKYWLTNRFNNTLLRYWKHNKKLGLSDIAIVYPLKRWIKYSRIPMIIRRIGRFLLKYWLFPYFSPFMIKDKYRWYQAKFFNKEDNNFLQHFYWKLTKYKTPTTTFHFYNNWFMFLLQDKEKIKKKFFKLNLIQKIKKNRRIKRLKRLKQWKNIRKLKLKKFNFIKKIKKLKRLKKFKLIQKIKKNQKVKKNQKIKKKLYIYKIFPNKFAANYYIQKHV